MVRCQRRTRTRVGLRTQSPVTLPGTARCDLRQRPEARFSDHHILPWQLLGYVLPRPIVVQHALVLGEPPSATAPGALGTKPAVKTRETKDTPETTDTREIRPLATSRPSATTRVLATCKAAGHASDALRASQVAIDAEPSGTCEQQPHQDDDIQHFRQVQKLSQPVDHRACLESGDQGRRQRADHDPDQQQA